MADGRSKFPSWGFDNAQRLLNRTGVISEIPTSLCQANKGKNVILVIGDGMGWEAERSGAIAKQVVEELKDYGCDIVKGCPDNEIAKEAFANRTLHDYYTQGPSLFV
jgi:alkaline phosphatase